MTRLPFVFAMLLSLETEPCLHLDGTAAESSLCLAERWIRRRFDTPIRIRSADIGAAAVVAKRSRVQLVEDIEGVGLELDASILA